MYSGATMKCPKWRAKLFLSFEIYAISMGFESITITPRRSGARLHTAHIVRMENTSREIILYRKLTMKTYYTHLLSPLNGCERASGSAWAKGLAAWHGLANGSGWVTGVGGENRNGNGAVMGVWHHVQFFPRIMLCDGTNWPPSI